MSPFIKIFIPLILRAGKRIEQNRFTQPPVYIGGCGRSGTTLLLSILSAHKSIFACPNELNLFFEAEEQGDRVVLPMIYRLYRTLIVRRIKTTADRYCEKSPANVQQIALIDKYHQGAFRMIHIIRDGRDVILSVHPKKAEDYWIETERWVRDVTLGLSYADHPCVLTIRYEELVNEFEKVIGSICTFLDINPSDEILNWHTHTTVRKNRALFSPIEEIHDTSIGKYNLPENHERLQEFMKNEEAVALLRKLEYL